MPRYVALIRGVNLGGHTVKMDRLKKLFEDTREALAVQSKVRNGEGPVGGENPMGRHCNARLTGWAAPASWRLSLNGRVVHGRMRSWRLGCPSTRLRSAVGDAETRPGVSLPHRAGRLTLPPSPCSP
jgi:hypothetical protein